jgi:hypothetical protein
MAATWLGALTDEFSQALIAAVVVKIHQILAKTWLGAVERARWRLDFAQIPFECCAYQVFNVLRDSEFGDGRDLL